MIPAAALNLFLLLTFATTMSAQDNQSLSLGDVARQARAAKTSAPRSTTVVTDDNLPKSKNQAATGKLSPEKQAFCDELRQRKDPMAEQGCAVLAIDMGPEYEDLIARYVELAKSVCAANHGQMPSTPPADPAIAAQWRELTNVAGRFAEMMKTEMKAFSGSEAVVNAIRQEEFTELAANVPDWNNAAAMSANPQKKQRFLDIQNKYRSRIQEKEDASNQEKARGQRFLYDIARLQQACGQH